MAYKNQSKNKKHNAELRKKNAGWKAAKKKKRYLQNKPEKEMTIAEMEYLISRM
jgi:hypothetical protein